MLIVLSACYAPRPVPPGVQLSDWASPETHEFSVPEVGVLSVGQVGDTLVRAGIETVYDTLVLEDGYQTAWPRGEGARDGGIAFKRGARLFLKGHAPGGTPVFTGFPPGDLTTVLSGSFDYGLGLQSDGTVRWLYAYGGLVAEVPGRGVAYTREPYAQARETDFVREFIYNGLH